jgi:hypothetical protein
MYADVALANAGDPSVQSAATPTDLNRTLSVRAPVHRRELKTGLNSPAQVIVEGQVFPLIAAFDVCYPLEFLLITNLKLLVAHRFYSVALRTSPAFPSRRLFNLVAVALNCLSAAGVALRCVAAHYRLQAAAAAAAAVAPSASLSDFYRLLASFLRTVDEGRRFASYQLLVEAAVLTAMALVQARPPPP